VAKVKSTKTAKQSYQHDDVGEGTWL